MLRRLLTLIILVLNVPRNCSWWPFRLSVRYWPRSDHPLLHLDTHIFRLLGQGEAVEVGSEFRVIAIHHWGLLLRLGHCRNSGTECLVKTKGLFGIVMQGYLVITAETLIETIGHPRDIKQVAPTVLPVERFVEVGIWVGVVMTDHRKARGCLVVDLLLRGCFLLALCFA